MPRAGTTSKKKVIAAKVSKEQRKRERKKIGRLRHQVISSKTEERYEKMFHQFLQFHALGRNFSMPSTPIFDDMVSEFVEHLWEEGEPKSAANYALAAIQFFKPQAKHNLPWSWKLVKVWNTVEMPQRATPLTPDLVLSLAGQALRWRQAEFAWLLIVGFTLFLRTGELLTLKAQDVVLSGHAGVVYLAPSKGAKRQFLPLERVEICERITTIAFRHLLKGKLPGDPLWSQSRPQFMTLWHDIVASLQLDDCHFYPYSLRRGGASSAYRAGSTLDQLVTKGRWSHVNTARLYLDLGLQALVSLTLPRASAPLLARARQFFVAASQKGTHGRGGPSGVLFSWAGTPFGQGVALISQRARHSKLKNCVAVLRSLGMKQHKGMTHSDMRGIPAVKSCRCEFVAPTNPPPTPSGVLFSWAGTPFGQGVALISQRARHSKLKNCVAVLRSLGMKQHKGIYIYIHTITYRTHSQNMFCFLLSNQTSTNMLAHSALAVFAIPSTVAHSMNIHWRYNINLLLTG